jgi:hypothetical protein
MAELVLLKDTLILRGQMAEIDLGPVIKKAMQAQLDHFKEEIRLLQEAAWDAGAKAALESPLGFVNPFSKENDSSGLDAGNSPPPA